MRIAFVLIGNSRRSNYLNGDTLRYGGGGGSGTDTSTILVAEYLASQGHDVVIATDKLEPALEQKYAYEGKFFPKGDKIRGVQYTDIEFNYIENKEFDILVNSLWFQDYKSLPIKITKAIVYWCHMQWIYGIGEAIEYCKTNNLNLGFVNISNWESQMNDGTIKHASAIYNKTYRTLIPNPIADDIITQVLNENIEKKPHKFIFHASWPRGGNVALEAVRRLDFQDKEFHAFDYLMVIHDHKDMFFHMHNGVDKYTLFKHLAESEYFVYPLYTPYQDVHKDTFSCVVAEALALGVIPITYPLGALPDIFGEYCAWIDFPKDKNAETMQKESLSKDLEGSFRDNIDNIVNKILFLESNPDIKNSLRLKSKDFVMDSFSVNKVGQMWSNFFFELSN